MIVLVAYFGAFIATRLISSWIYGEEVWKRYKHASLKVVLCVGCFQNILYCFSIVLNPPESSSFDGIILQLRWPSWWSYYHSKSTACIIIVAIHRTACSNLLCLGFFAQNRPVVSNCHGHFALNANPCHIREQPFSD